MRNPDYDWIVIGSGAAGIAIAEILSRAGLSVLILEKNQTLASETTKIFHEWLHTGTLYTLVPDSLKTTRYLLGAIDDLLEYYSGNERMNLAPSEAGLGIGNSGWFNNINVLYKYKARPLNPIWSLAVARAKWLIRDINAHDWLRRRAGSLHDGVRFNLKEVVRNYPRNSSGFIEVQSPDVTINSRVLLSDLLSTFEAAGGQVLTDVDVEKIIDHGNSVEVMSPTGIFRSRHVAICCADGLSKFIDARIKISYAPMFVVDGINDNTKSFVELDYYVKRCINLINKGEGIGLAGGISVSREDEVQSYLDYCIKIHRHRNPSIRVLDTYVGLKKELVGKRQDRNYLYHINAVSENVWGVVLGKFTLMFSVAPEFFRRIYHKNPPRISKATHDKPYIKHPSLSNPEWVDIILRNGTNNGND